MIEYNRNIIEYYFKWLAMIGYGCLNMIEYGWILYDLIWLDIIGYDWI